MPQDATGAADFHRLATRLKDADKPLRRRVNKALRDIAKPLALDMRESGAEAMPGGLADIVRTARPTVQLLRGSGPAGGKVAIKLRLPGHDLVAMEDGRLKHPTFGHKPWVLQSVDAGAFTKPFLEAGPKVNQALRRQVQITLDEIG